MDTKEVSEFFMSVDWAAVLLWLVLVATVLGSVYLSRDRYSIQGRVVAVEGDNVVIRGTISGWSLDCEKVEPGQHVSISSRFWRTRVRVIGFGYENAPENTPEIPENLFSGEK